MYTFHKICNSSSIRQVALLKPPYLPMTHLSWCFLLCLPKNMQLRGCILLIYWCEESVLLRITKVLNAVVPLPLGIIGFIYYNISMPLIPPKLSVVTNLYIKCVKQRFNIIKIYPFSQHPDPENIEKAIFLVLLKTILVSAN